MKLVKIHAHVTWLMLIDKAPLDLVVQIATPENICFEYRLAGPLRRFHAMTLDFIVRLAIILLLFFVELRFPSWQGSPVWELARCFHDGRVIRGLLFLHVVLWTVL